MRRPLAVIALLLVTLTATACGAGDLDQVRQQAERTRTQVEQRVRDRVERARRDFERSRRRFGDRLREVLAGIERQAPPAQRTDPSVRSRGRTSTTTIDAFLTDVLRSVDGYWTKTLTASGLPAPSVAYQWVPPGRVVPTACGNPADDSAAFYCPGDDTIYVAQRFATDLYRGVARNLPGEQAGYGHAAGDFAVAYVLAHEYGHNLQQELGIFDNRITASAEPFELQADCFAGTWANSVYAQGLLEPGDIQEAANTALAVGDFDYGNAQHHGTPQERADALLAGFRSGDPGQCSRYVAPQ